MGVFEILRSFARRRLRRLLAFVERYRQHRYILQVPISPHQLNLQHHLWWSNESVWYPGGTPPRIHNQVKPLIDGEKFFGELQQTLSQAKDYVFIAGWSLTPNIPLQRDNPTQLLTSRLLVLLNEVAQQVPVRIVLWNGAPFLFKPDTHQTSQVARLIENQAQGDLKCYLDSSAPLSHCHHQKAIVVDGQVAFVGGMDLTTMHGDRYDTQEHSLRAGLNWHDVQLKIEGEAVADVEENFRQRWHCVVKKEEDQVLPRREPLFEQNWHTPVQILRTIPRHIYHFAPQGEFGIYHAYINLIDQAKRFIYIENQYLWSPHILDALTAALKKPRVEPFRIVIVLPAKAEDGKLDNDQHVQKLRELDQGRGLISVYSLYTSGPNQGQYPFTYRAIYVHAKVVIVDDEWFMVGSANLNNRGLITDSEINAVVHDRELACKLRIGLWSEHLGIPEEQIAQVEPTSLIDQEWPKLAAINEELLKKKEQPLYCAVYPYQSGDMPGVVVLEEVETLTLEH
jgi:phosphatidylserine/phosphatidylglycerophosphate/cardiolipin synthase-like enzyme